MPARPRGLNRLDVAPIVAGFGSGVPVRLHPELPSPEVIRPKGIKMAPQPGAHQRA